MSTISVADVYTQNRPTIIVPKTKNLPELVFDHKAIRTNIIQIAQQLYALGVKTNEVVSMSLPNSHEIVFSFLGIQVLGATANPLNPNYTVEEFKFYLDDTNCKIIIVPYGTPDNAAVIQAAKLTKTSVAYIETIARSGSIVTRLNSPSSISKIDLPPVSNTCTGLILHTSGTTSRPKAVPLTLINLLESSQNICSTYSFTRADRGLLIMPLFHVHGLLCGLLAPMLSGGTIVIQAPKFSASRFFPLLLQYNITWFTAVPTMHQILLHKLDSLPADKRARILETHKLRFLRSCSSALSPATYASLVDTWKVPICEAYAMTEASHQMTSNPLPPLQRKPGTVGFAHGSVTVAILDDEGKEVPNTVEGEICVKGPNVTSGYLNNPKANAETFVNGYLRTGDRGKKDEDGYVIITGRLKEQINRGGEKIMPGEIDNVLLSHPYVSEAVCYGVDHVLLGQTVHAAVKLKAEYAQHTERFKEYVESIKQHAGKVLAKFKVPEVIHITAQIPKTATGKIQRRIVAEHFTPVKSKL